jgi:hypothetical protein
MDGADDVFAANRALGRRRLWQVPLGLVAILIAFIAGAFLLAVIETLTYPSSDLTGFFSLVVLILRLAFVMVTFFAFPQAAMIIKLKVANVWARALTGAVSGWMYLFAGFIEAQLLFRADTDHTVKSVSIALWKIAVGLPQQIAYFAVHESLGTLLFFAVLGAAFGIFFWKPMYRLGRKRDWDDPILAGRPPYAR